MVGVMVAGKLHVNIGTVDHIQKSINVKLLNQ